MSFLASFFRRQLFYTPPIPTASFEGKTVIVTGSNVGLGLEACRWLVRLGASQVILACRNIEKGKAAAKDIQTTTLCSPDVLQVWKLDMSSYDSVIAFAEKAKSELSRLDAVLANAGIATRKFGTTEDNEETITTNVVSLFLLGFLLRPKLHETAEKFNVETHLTITASELYEVAKFQERNAPDGKIFATLNDKSTANMADRYNVSKLLEVLMVKQMAAMFPLTSSRVIINSVAPGFCHSDLTREVKASSAMASALLGVFKKLFARSTEVGSRTLLYGASVGPESHGQYVPDCNIKPTKGLTTGEGGAELQKRVWVELRDKLDGIRNGITALV